MNRLAITSVDAIMRLRWFLLFEKEGCSSFEPTEQMLKGFNSEQMYNSKAEDVELFSGIP
jgi:hypothetical protein